MIAVMGATGRTGGAIVRLLVEQGENVRAVGRWEDKLAELKLLGAETAAGDTSDAAFLESAFGGADAVYTLLPHDPADLDYHAAQNRMGEATVEAVRRAGVRHVVFLSSIGADQASGTGLLTSLHAQERRWRELDGVHVLVLRPGAFFENFYGMLDFIKQEGILGDSVAPDVGVPMIATRDIAAVAAKALTARDWAGVVVRELLGPRDLSYAETARIIGDRIGNPNLEYVAFPYPDMAAALTQIGCSEDFARLHVEFTRALNDGRIKSVEGRNAANTTSTRFEDFAVELAHVYHETGEAR